MEKLKQLGKKMAILVMAVIITLTGNTGIFVKQAEASTALGTISIICYLRGSTRATTYKAVNGAYSGYIDANDKCTITNVYDNGWVKVDYPTSKGTKSAYTYSSNFFVNTDFSSTKVSAGSKWQVYKKSDLASSLGTIYSTDSVICVGTENNKQQVIYPISGSNQYKMGFINGTISTTSQTNDTALITNTPVDDICFDYIYYSNKYSDLKKAFGTDKEKLLNHWKEYGIKEGRSASPILDLKYYVQANSDLQKAFGNDYVKAYNHFVTDGYKEYRASSPYYNGQYYRSAYSDLSSYDNLFLLKHYLKYGISEGRKAGDVLYPESNPNGRENLVNYAVSQIGIGDKKGNNNVIYNTWYYNKSVSGSGYAWCQAFVSYCADKCGLLDTYIPKTNSCQAGVNWFKKKGQFYKSKYYGGNYTPKKGDIVYYTNNGSKSCHVGIITASPVNGYLQVVEGNVLDSSDGNYKVRKFTKNAKRKVGSSYVMGYGVPNY